jgi:hypothetical protein
MKEPIYCRSCRPFSLCLSGSHQASRRTRALSCRTQSHHVGYERNGGSMHACHASMIGRAVEQHDKRRHFVPVLAQGNMSHRPSSSTHPSKTTDASNIYTINPPQLSALAPSVHATEMMKHPMEERWALTWHPW